MNLLPALRPIVEEVRRRFGTQIESCEAPHPDEIYLRTNQNTVSALCAFLYRKFHARLTNVFAEDARSNEGCFHIHRVLALDAAHGYLIARTSISPEKPEFLSMTTAVPAVNWHEREIQDWFGLKAIGHPNPRRMALHDDWPQVHPMRKDFVHEDQNAAA